LAVVGFAAELIAIPLAVIVAPPSEVTFPPLDTLLEVMPDVAVVVTVGVVINVAVQVLLAFMVTEPSEQSASPLQPEKLEPEFGVAVRVIVVPDV
jgi:hypothetical protein